MSQGSLFDLHDKPVPPPAVGPKCSPVVIGERPRELAFDIESTGPNPISHTAVGISLCKEPGTAVYVPVRHAGGPNVPEAFTILKPILEDAAVPKIGHNLKFDILMLRNEGIAVSGRLFDTMVAAYLLNPNRPEQSLESVGLEYLQHKKRSFIEVLAKRASFAEVPVAEAVQYGAEDSLLAYELKQLLFPMLATEGLAKLYFDIEMPLIQVLADMEALGISVDCERLGEISKELARELDTLQEKIYTLAGGPFNINSPKQLSKILFEDLGLKPGKKTKTGFSTSVDVLEELAKHHPLPAEILAYRTFYKLKTTYVDVLPTLVCERTNRIHTSFNQTVTATGRLSSSDPNIQNIPVRGEWGPKLREVFVAKPGCVLLSADYSQIEIRVLAHMSGDEILAEAFRRNVDIHTRTAAEIYGIGQDAVTPEMRRVAKTVNFGVIYGISAYGLSESLGIAPREAGAIIEQYFLRHRGVQDYMQATLENARETGYVMTMLGRKRPIPEINSANMAVRQAAERMAINMPVQGTAADLIKIAMINIWRSLADKKLKTRMLLQIHDELLFEVPENELDEVSPLIRDLMESALPLSVPLQVNIGTGKNWAEAH